MTQGDRSDNLAHINSLLQAAADCASALLSDDDFERGVNRALEILGTSIGADRLVIGEQHNDSSGQTLGYVVAIHEWLSPHANSQIHHPELKCVSYDGVENCHYALASGKHWGGLIKTLPEPFRSGQEKLGVKATYAIPIMVRGQYWGFVGLDFCRTAKELCEAEIAVLKTAATCIGSAIQRERNQRAKEKAERKALLQQQKAIELQKRDRLLKLTASAAQALLNNENLENAIATALEIIGKGIETDRVAVMEHCDDHTKRSLGYLKMLYEWHCPDAVSQLQHPELQEVSYEGIEDWYEQLIRGEAVGGIVEELPEPVRSGQVEIGVKSTYSVPITIEGEYWGLIGLDNCKEAKQRNETEISILKTVATCIGSKIQQNRICQEREAAERSAFLQQHKAAQLQVHNRVLEQRDRILAATAKASNVLLTGTDFDKAVKKALQIIGESIDTDRVGILEHIEDPSGRSLGYIEIIYEWDSPFAVSQLNHPEASLISLEDIEEWYYLSCKGEWTGGLIDELPRPFRSKMAQIGVKATYGIPIAVDGKFWGIIGIDDCREVARRSEAELSILKTAAACIGGAIKRERTQRAKEEAERNILLEREKTVQEKAAQLEESNRVLSLRERWLEATAKAANQLLATPNLDTGINAALKVLGESLDCDRLQVWQLIYTPVNDIPKLGRIIYEWKIPNIGSQISHPNLNEMPVEELGEEWIEQLLNGEWVGGAIDELSEPFRDTEIKLGAKSTYIVPFFLNGTWWGTVSMDFCQKSRILTPAEIAVFKTAASCVGSAIYRQQIQQEKERAELAILDERNRMAREIHDTLAQAFTGISLQLEAARNSLGTNTEIAIERLLQAKNLAKEGISEARRSVRALRPEALEFGLPTALHQLVDKMLLGTKLKAEISIEGETRTLTSEIEVELFRIAQEALTNVIRHAQATEIGIQLIYEPDTIYLQIKDNGIGFDLQQIHNEGFGLLGMRERCDRLDGNLVIDSAVGQGTKITITVVAD